MNTAFSTIWQCERCYIDSAFAGHRSWHRCWRCVGRRAIGAVVLATVLMAAWVAIRERAAQGQEPDAGTPVPVTCVAERGKGTVKLCAGQPAPFSGFLVSRDEFEALVVAKEMGPLPAKYDCALQPACTWRDGVAIGVGVVLGAGITGGICAAAD